MATRLKQNKSLVFYFARFLSCAYLRGFYEIPGIFFMSINKEAAMKNTLKVLFVLAMGNLIGWFIAHFVCHARSLGVEIGLAVSCGAWLLLLYGISQVNDETAKKTERMEAMADRYRQTHKW